MVNLFSVSFSHYIITMVSNYVFTTTVCHCGFVPIIRLYWFHVYFFIYIKCTVSLTYCTDTYLWNSIWKVLMSCVTSSLTLQRKRCALLVILSFWETERWIVHLQTGITGFSVQIVNHYSIWYSSSSCPLTMWPIWFWPIPITWAWACLTIKGPVLIFKSLPLWHQICAPPPALVLFWPSPPPTLTASLSEQICIDPSVRPQHMAGRVEEIESAVRFIIICHI